MEYEDHGLYHIVRVYLESKGWYWDEEHFVYVWERPSIEKDQRDYHYWTLPQWGAYWHPSSLAEQTSRRHEDFWTAVKSQMLRELEPETYECFYAETEAT